VKAGKNSPAIRVHAGSLIGQAHIDVTFLTDRLPTGDEKHVASDHAVSFGGQSCSVLAVRSMPSSKGLGQSCPRFCSELYNSMECISAVSSNVNAVVGFYG
jgi:hypothetical protein